MPEAKLVGISLPQMSQIQREIEQGEVDSKLESLLERYQLKLIPPPLTTLPFYHRDPFDRLLIVQVMVERILILSVDAAFDAYAVTRLW